MAMPTSSWTLTARWVFPVDGPPLQAGVVSIADDRIVAVEAHGRQIADVNLGDAAVLPGLVNAHTHLDLSGMRGLAPPTPHFTDWLRQVIAHRRGRTPEQIQADIRAGLAECLRFGTTLLGDISGQGLSWLVLAEAAARSVVFYELLGLTRKGSVQAWTNLTAWLAERPRLGHMCRPGISPHAPYSVRAEMFRSAASIGLPIAVHLAETVDELELLEHHSGPFVSFLNDLGVWDPTGLAKSPERILWNSRHAASASFAHCNYLRLDSPIPSNGTIVYCPRTHAAFGHPPHPFREFLARGVRVAVGTDSLASNPDLDVLAEIRFLHRLYPDLPGAAAAHGHAVRRRGARLGRRNRQSDARQVGRPRRRAAAADDADPHRLLLGGDAPVSRVLFRGRWVGQSAA